MFSFSEKKFSPVSLWCTRTPNELSVDRLRVTTFREIKLFVVFAFCSFYTVYDSQRSGLHIHSGTGDECDFASANQSGRISLRLMNCPGVGQGHPTGLNMIHFFSFFLFFVCTDDRFAFLHEIYFHKGTMWKNEWLQIEITVLFHWQ